jgi:hypothetical protein
MREISIPGGTGKPFVFKSGQRQMLKECLQLEHLRSDNSRFGWENTLKQAIRMYQGDPPEKLGWVPFENAPTVEITTGATQADQILSQAEDLIFQTNPVLTIQSRKDEFDNVAEDIQELVKWGTNNGANGGPWRYEPGLKEGLIDNIQAGTCIGYVPFIKTARVTDIRRVVDFGPKVMSVAPEHFMLPASATKDIQSAKFCTMVQYMDRSELRWRSEAGNWMMDEAASADGESKVRHDRLRAAGIFESAPEGPLKVKVGYTFIYFDFHDGMGERDLEVIWNMTSGGILKCMYNRYNCRPFVLECYQDRAHSWAGLGVLEMDAPYGRLATETWNGFIWNLYISCTKMYQAPAEMMNESQEIYPGKIWERIGEGIEAIDMGELNPQAIQAFQLITGMSSARIGTNQLTAPLRGGNRTPGISMLSMLQQANRRFTHPFNNMRNFGAQLAIQCLYRIQEQVKGGPEKAATVKALKQIMGDEKADRIIALFRRTDIELTDALDVQLTAASVSVNREADRQNMVMLMTQVMPLYWNGKKELAQIIAQPPFPGAKETAMQADQLLEKLKNKVLQTFDEIADGRTMTIDLSAVAQMAEQMDAQFAQLTQGQPQQGAPPAPQMPPASPNGTPPVMQ